MITPPTQPKKICMLFSYYTINICILDKRAWVAKRYKPMASDQKNAGSNPQLNNRTPQINFPSQGYACECCELQIPLLSHQNKYG